MKQVLKQLTPNAFRRIDDYLLRNYPTVWRTRIHIVLPLALLAFPVLFAARYFLPKNYPIVFFSSVIAIVIYWGYTQYQQKFVELRLDKALGTILIYIIGLFAILSLYVIAFKLKIIILPLDSVLGEMTQEQITSYLVKLLVIIPTIGILLFIFPISSLKALLVFIVIIFFSAFRNASNPNTIIVIFSVMLLCPLYLILSSFRRKYNEIIIVLNTQFSFMSLILIVSAYLVSNTNTITDIGMVCFFNFFFLIIAVLFSYLKGLPKSR